jgi:hypothetical protein
LALGLLLLLTGCKTVEDYSLTYRLWNDADLRKWNEPAEESNLALYQVTNGPDVLVEYDAFSDRRSATRRRAFYLQPNEERIAAGKKPRYVRLKEGRGMKPITVLSPEAATNRSAELATYAVPVRDGKGFTLHQPEGWGTYDLPVYPENGGTPTRLVLTPFAVVGDAVMASAAVATVGFFMWVESGAYYSR